MTPPDEHQPFVRALDAGQQARDVAEDVVVGELDVAGRRAQDLVDTGGHRAEVDAVRMVVEPATRGSGRRAACRSRRPMGTPGS